MGQARRKGQQKIPPRTRPLQDEEALQVALLGTCQITLLQLEARVKLEPDRTKRETRQYWIERMRVAIEGIDLTIDGYVNEEFERKYLKYHRMIEGDLQALLATYKGRVD